MHAHRPSHVSRGFPDEWEVDRRALALWPRLDHRALWRCHHDLGRVASLVERRTSLPATAIRTVLGSRPTSPDEVETWFG